MFWNFFSTKDGMDAPGQYLSQNAHVNQNEEQPMNDSHVQQIIEQILYEDYDDIDSGAQIGLVFAGLMRFVKESRTNIKKKCNIFNLVLAGKLVIRGVREAKINKKVFEEWYGLMLKCNEV